MGFLCTGTITFTGKYNNNNVLYSLCSSEKINILFYKKLSNP